MPSDKSTRSPKDQQSPDHNGEIITPLKVHGRSSEGDSSRPLRSRVISISLLVTLLTAIAVGGFILISQLSRHPVNLTDTGDQTAQPEQYVDGMPAPAPDPFYQQQTVELQQTTNTEQGGHEKEIAENSLAEFLKLKREIEDKGAAEWGGEKYDEMITLSEEADALLMDNAFLPAADKYMQAGRKAALLADSAALVFQRMIEEGQMAMEDGDSVTAGQKFRTALMIEPSSKTAMRQLKRSERLDGVNRLIASGKNHERENRPAFAHSDYQEALKLDPESKEAQTGMDRVKELIVDDQFQKLMSDGLTAYHRADYERARTMLMKAKSFRNDSQEVKSALMQVDEAIRLDKIEKLGQKALTAEQSENWEQALKSYLTVLTIDPHITFAAEGKERALEQIRVAKRITFFLQNSGTLESNQQLQNALLVIEEAERLEPRGPRLSAQLAELNVLVDRARTPIKVMIESDDLTEVAVYKVGKLGKFTTRELSLRPGTYTVVGSRDGYRDVRKHIIVKHDQKVLYVTIICRDKV